MQWVSHYGVKHVKSDSCRCLGGEALKKGYFVSHAILNLIEIKSSLSDVNLEPNSYQLLATRTMPPHKGKATTAKPDPTRMATRAKNADIHPGTKAKDTLRVHRPQEEIQKEKDVQAAKKKAKEQRDEMENKIADEIAEFEDQVAIAAAHADAQFPTHQTGM